MRRLIGAEIKIFPNQLEYNYYATAPYGTGTNVTNYSLKNDSFQILNQDFRLKVEKFNFNDVIISWWVRYRYLVPGGGMVPYQ